MTRIVLATGNPGKVRELADLLADGGIEILPQSDFGVPEAIENGLTFVENALIKARNAAAHTGLPAIADDSGLEVDALDGAPGIHSSRYAGQGAADADNNAKLLEALRDTPDEQRTAGFRCVIVYLRHAADPAPLIAQGVWRGSVLRAPQGEGGFGYDPLFFVPAEGCAAAELDRARKGQISHRGQALRAFLDAFGSQSGSQAGS